MKTHFARILDLRRVNYCIGMLNKIPDGARFSPVKSGDETFKIIAPDGDVVFSGLRHSGGKYICRLHREVFDE